MTSRWGRANRRTANLDADRGRAPCCGSRGRPRAALLGHHRNEQWRFVGRPTERPGARRLAPNEQVLRRGTVPAGHLRHDRADAYDSTTHPLTSSHHRRRRPPSTWISTRSRGFEASTMSSICAPNCMQRLASCRSDRSRGQNTAYASGLYDRPHQACDGKSGPDPGFVASPAKSSDLVRLRRKLCHYGRRWACQGSILAPDSPMIRVRKVAVGTPITERPPHRTVRARFGHTAPTSGV